MALIETWYNQDLKTPVAVHYLHGNVFSQDNQGNLIGVHVFDDGEPATLAGSVSGSVIRPDGATLAVSGTLSGNDCYIILPESAYAIVGVISIIIKLTGSGSTTTLCAVVANVYQTSTDTIVDPSEIIPSIADLIAEIEQAVASIPADYSELMDNVSGLNEYITDNNMSVLASITGKYVDRYGTEQTSSVLRHSDYVEIPIGAIGIKTYPYAGTYYVHPVCCIYDASKTLIGYFDPNSQTDYHSTGFTGRLNQSIFRNAKYIKFNVSNIASDASLSYFKFLYDYSIMHVPNGSAFVDNDDTNDIKPNTIRSRFSYPNNVSNVPYYNWLGNMLSLYGGSGDADYTGMCVIALSHDRRMHIRDCWGADKTWSAWLEIAMNYSGRQYYKGQFESAQQQIVTKIYLAPNTSYKIHFNSEITGRINIFGHLNTNNFTFVNPDKRDAILKNDGTLRYLDFYNYSGNLDELDVVITKLHYQDQINPTYYISLTDPMADFDSITDCFLALKNDTENKTIIIDGGDYDIYQEYVNANVPVYTGDNPSMDYYDYCVWVPKNSHIIGQGIVRMKWMPTSSQVTEAQSKTVSPLNVDDTCTIENIEVHCKNGRYCLHNDALDKAGKNGAIEKYIDCKFYKYINDSGLGFAHTTGFGLNKQNRHEYINCAFYNEGSGRAFYGHTWSTVAGVTLTEAMSSDIFLTNCIINTEGDTAIKFGTGANANVHVLVMFSGCYINKKIRLSDESGDGGTNQNQYDLTLLNSGDPEIEIASTNNPYPPKVYS